MKILKYKKGKKNEYKVLTDTKEYIIYDDIIIKYELLLKKEINDQEWDKLIKENNLLKAYYTGLDIISKRLKTEKELKTILNKKGYSSKEIEYSLNKLKEEGYLEPKTYIVAYIHDAITLNVIGENKIKDELEKRGFKEQEILEELNKIDHEIYLDKIKKYINKKLKGNTKSANLFKQKIMIDLIHKGFRQEDIMGFLEKLDIEDNLKEVEKIIDRLYNKYINKYDLYTTKMKIKNYLYTKGYQNIDMDKYLEKNSYK